MHVRLSTKLLAATSVIAFALPTIAHAQDAAGQEQAPAADANDEAAASANDEIVVTAQRRQERVVDVPISITVADAAQLERQQVRTIGDLSRIAPSLEVMTGGQQAVGGGGIIRGVGTQTFSAGAQAAVGIVVDQVAQGNANMSDLFDVSRIEVLKGPQGTLFGLTTSAGVINITTAAPDPSAFAVRFRTELAASGFAGSETGGQVFQLATNIPLSSNAALRVSGSWNMRQGPQRNLAAEGENEFTRTAVRARLLWEPSDSLSINLIGDYTASSSHGVDFFTFTTNSPTSDPRGGIDLAARMRLCGVIVEEGNFDYCSDRVQRQRDSNYGASLGIDYDMGFATLTSITAYRGNETNLNFQSIYRADPLAAVNASIFTEPQIEDTELFTQELRLSSPAGAPLEYTIGGFYSKSNTFQTPRTNRNTQPPVRLGGPIRATVRPRGAVEVDDESIAAFGQVTWHATDALRLIGGLRYTHAKLSAVQALIPSGSNGTSIETEKLSYRAGIQYDVAPRTMIYATVNRGFKGPQISIPSDPTVSPFPLNPEIPQAYDLGLKTTLFGGWILDLNAFHQKIDDFQAQQCALNATTGLINCQQVNIDYIKSYGAEINLFGRVTEGLTVNTGFIYANTVYGDGVIGKDGSDVSGKQIAFAPKYKFTFSGEYERELGSSLKGFVAADAVWKSRVRFQQSSQSGETFRPHWIVGGRVGVRLADDKVTAAVFARNLFAVREPFLMQQPLALAFPNAVGVAYGPNSARQVGLSLDVKF